MLSARSLLGVRRGSVVAPAGHGKTELIAKITGLARRTLVLTHTHAGVHALRGRMARLGIDPRAAAVDTIAGWTSRYISAFPTQGKPLGRMPIGDEWSSIYKGGQNVLSVSPVRDVISASYDRVLVDEYQDCDLPQHQLVILLAQQLPTIVFGDPMQGIFDFRESPSVSWERDVFPEFPLVGALDEPMRWRKTNPALGEWVAFARSRLERGETLNLQDGPATYLQCENEYDLSPLFHELDTVQGTIAALHCWRGTCDQLAKASRGAYQAIEDIACKALQEFANAWDQSSPSRRETLLRELLKSSVTCKPLNEGEDDNKQDKEILAKVSSSYRELSLTGNPRTAFDVLEAVRQHSRARIFRSELVRDTSKALLALAEGKHSNLTHSAFVTRQRVSHVGRSLPRRTISTPLLLKGLEFDRVAIPAATHFNRGKNEGTRAKLFYVALSRARSALVISSSNPAVRFPLPS